MSWLSGDTSWVARCRMGSKVGEGYVHELADVSV